MKAQTPCMRVVCALRLTQHRQILVNMENFSTLKQAALPWATNLTTLAVVLSATWWSSAQRPLAAPADTLRMTAASQHASAQRQSGATLNGSPAALVAITSNGLPGNTPANTPFNTPATALSSDGFMSVSFNNAGLR